MTEPEVFPTRRQTIVVVGVLLALAVALLVYRFGFAEEASLKERAEQATTCVELSALDDEYGERFGDEILSGDELVDVGAGRSEPSKESIESLAAAITIMAKGKELGCPGYG